MTSALYDFRHPTPLPGELLGQLDSWLAEVVRRAPKAWGKVLKSPPELQARGCKLVVAGDCAAHIPEGALAFRVALAPGGPLSLLVMPRPLMLLLLGGALGEKLEALPENRDTTRVEDALCDHLIRTLLMQLFRDAWPGGRSLTLELREREPEPQAMRLFPPGDGVLVCSFRVTGTFGELDWCWLLPRSGWLEDAAPANGPPAAARVAKVATPQMEVLARLIPVEIVIQLGNAELTLSEIERLKTGDLIVLDRDTNQPLPAAIAGAERFYVMPGAVGTRQAVRIQAVAAS